MSENIDPITPTSDLSRRNVLLAGSAAAALAMVGGNLALDRTASRAATARFVWPFPLSTVYAEFGWRNYPPAPNHLGIDFSYSPASLGAAVRCAGDGIVTHAESHNKHYNCWVRVDHGGGLVTRYHMMNPLQAPAVGQAVSQGQILGYIGAAWGTGSGPHLHFQTEENGVPINPRVFMSKYAGTVVPTEPTTAPASAEAIVTSSGLIALYQTTADGSLRGTNQATPGGSFQPWSLIGSAQPGVIARPSVVQMSTGALTMYSLSSAGTILGSGQSTAGAAFSAWTTIGDGGSGVSGPPAVLVDAQDVVSLYVTTDSGTLAGVTQPAAGAPFGSWQQLGALSGFFLQGRPAAIRRPSGVIELYAHTTDNRMARSVQTAPGATFGPWQIVGTGGGGIASNPAVITTADGRISVYAITDHGNFSGITESTPGGAFGAWSQLGDAIGTLRGNPSVVLHPSGSIVAYARDEAGNIRGSGQGTPGGSFSAWGIMGTGSPRLVTDPLALIAPNNTIAIYSTTADGVVRGVSQASVGGSFGPWGTLG
ncbi:peptidoglycan DD-metalloendopeptidase family protein [Mycetocola spongiae]|uniref:peptidoglycan DD-metalloendopeptidase family protein n=1 Tax=Mycetocola spongiae TaxID=2859226 RepID=UPI001CF28AA6|nr:peptidoglycan DD-metalloendopeptidase family protein [Mycetocola spongiae]UCR89512.1 M23 family metallopeptidase [Mycetocola spongiae]